MLHTYNPSEFTKNKLAKQDFAAKKQATPAPASVAQLLARLTLLEKLLNV